MSEKRTTSRGKNDEFDACLEGLALSERVAHLVMSWGYLCKSPENLDALQRLATRTEAMMAWEKLRAMETKSESWSFDSVVSWIGRETVGCFIPDKAKKTSKEIKDAGERASKLAAELAELIEQNSTLRFFDDQLAPPVDVAAIDRLCRGITFSGGAFSEDVERTLNDLQERDFPEFKGMTTRRAEIELSLGYCFRDAFVHRLRQFSELAAKSSFSRPLLPRPNDQSADRHIHALIVCDTLDMAYGAPCIEIAASLTSAVFDCVVDSDVVKKWWQRRDVATPAGDTSEDIG